MLQADIIKTLLFTILCICFIFYLSIGIYTYRKDKESKGNIVFLLLCISTSLWAMGYAFMLISPNIQTANIYRIVSSLGLCFFNSISISFVFSLKYTKQTSNSLKIQFLAYITSMIFFIYNLTYESSKAISIRAYGFVDKFFTTSAVGIVFSIYLCISFMGAYLIGYFLMKNSQKNRVKKQFKLILITVLISYCSTAMSDFILPSLGIVTYPFGIISIFIGMSGMWYAITKYKMMSISYELVSEYLFETVNEPIFILGEDFLVKNCNKAALNITGYNYIQLEQNSISKIINFKDLDFNTIIQTGSVINPEVELQRENQEAIICELSATVIYDEYKDILGILTLLHDVSERKKIEEIQRKYFLELEGSNLKLQNEVSERLLAEEQIRHFIYYDTLTGIYNRKKMQEDVDILLTNKNESFAFLFIDLDKFKNTNDNYGHQAGDYILKTVAIRLKSIIRLTDTIYRIGGDEFIIILRNLKSIANAEKIAVAISQILNTAFIYKENLLYIGASIGISIFPEDGIDEDMLSTKADLAMYEVKRKGVNGYKIYSS